jgi:hypothetical protein
MTKHSVTGLCIALVRYYRLQCMHGFWHVWRAVAEQNDREVGLLASWMAMMGAPGRRGAWTSVGVIPGTQSTATRRSTSCSCSGSSTTHLGLCSLCQVVGVDLNDVIIALQVFVVSGLSPRTGLLRRSDHSKIGTNVNTQVTTVHHSQSTGLISCCASVPR